MRIRTIKPEFWEDEIIGSLTRDSRLLYIATWNLADDEGLLRWTAEFLKANAFIYDARVNVAALMQELVGAGLIVPYRAGRTQQWLAWIPTFLRHQRINRPQPSKLPAPPLTNIDVRLGYRKLEGNTCHLCGEEMAAFVGNVMDGEPGTAQGISLDHLKPKSLGGTDYPSNIRAAHHGCNAAKGNRSVNEPVGHSVNESVNDATKESLLEGEREGEPEQGTERNGVALTERRDELFEAIAEVCGIDWHELTDSARGPLNKAVAQIRGLDVTPEDVRTRAANWPALFDPDTTLTPTALAKHWPALKTARNGKSAVSRHLARSETRTAS